MARTTLAYNRRRWGSDGWTHSLRAKGRKVGAPLADWKIWPNTLRAHQLLRFAPRETRPQLKKAMFEAIYEKTGSEGRAASWEITSELRQTMDNVASMTMGRLKFIAQAWRRRRASEKSSTRRRRSRTSIAPVRVAARRAKVPLLAARAGGSRVHWLLRCC